jgi:AraC-like DNA-binding protein
VGTFLPPARRWSTEGIRPQDLTEAWQRALCRSYRQWEVPQRLPAEFTALMWQLDLGEIQLIECVCDPCAGRRLPRQFRHDEPHIGIQITRAGAERFRTGDATLSIAPGDLIIWSSDRATEFEVTERLHKVTLMVPLRLLESRLPRGTALCGGVLERGSGLTPVLYRHVETLAAQAGSLSNEEGAALQRVTVELIAAVLAHRRDGLAAAPSAGLSRQYLKNVQDYILDHLHESDLDLERIAKVNRISVRYLHRLFEQTGQSASGWIQRRRLERCRDALADPAFRGTSIAEIASQWGFSDPSHFSRVFKLHLGRSPGRFRSASAHGAIIDGNVSDGGVEGRRH